jgi:purine-binding chemotaxis protein CheW
MSEPESGRVVVCRVGGKRFAVPITAVRDIVAAPELTRIPGVSSVISGIANVRGTVVTAVSGRILLDPDAPAEESFAESADWLLVLTLQEGRVGLVLDEVEDLQTATLTPALPLLDIEALVTPILAAEIIRA